MAYIHFYLFLFIFLREAGSSEKMLSYRQLCACNNGIVCCETPIETVKCLCLLLTKPWSDFPATWSVTQSTALCWQSCNFVYLPHKFLGRMFTDMGHMLGLILQALVFTWRHRYITSISAYFYYITVANTINSQESEDCHMTDKLL
jgi:hypothetical protein